MNRMDLHHEKYCRTNNSNSVYNVFIRCNIQSEQKFKLWEDFFFQKWIDCGLYMKVNTGSSLVAQWLRIRLPMQGTQVRALAREEPTCRRVTKPMCHNYWACALEPGSHNYWAQCATTTEARTPRGHAAQQREATAMRSPCTATKSSSHSLQLEKARVQQRRPNAAKNKNK